MASDTATMNFKVNILGVASAAIITATALAPAADAARKVRPSTTTTSTWTFEQQMGADMTIGSEAIPHGVPTSWGWPVMPRPNMGNNPEGFTAFIPWGQVYECATGNPQPLARAELQGLTSYILSKRTGAWNKVVTSTKLDGSAFREDYTGDDGIPAPTIITSTGTTTVTVGNGRNYHFWPSSGKSTIDPTDVGGVVTFMRARLVPETVSSSLAAPCMTLSVGSDYWRSLEAGWVTGQVNNDDAAIGRFKKVTSTWRVYGMSTLSATALKAKPLPVSIAQSELR